MTVKELEEKREEIYKQLCIIDKEIKDKKIEETYKERGDILKDKWVIVGDKFYFSYGSSTPADAYEVIEFLESNSKPNVKIAFKGFEIHLGEKGIGITNHSFNGEDIEIRLNYCNGNFNIIDKNDIESFKHIIKEKLKIMPIFNCYINHDFLKLSINPEINIEFYERTDN